MVVWTSGSLRWAEIEKRIVILDFSTEEYTVLNPDASRIWIALQVSNGVVELAVEALATDNRGAPAAVGHQTKAFVQSCLNKSLLTTQPVGGQAGLKLRVGSHARNDLVSPSPLRAWWSLFRTARLLARKGFSSTYAEYSRLQALSGISRPELFKRAETAFLRAENLFAFKVAPLDCLPRSLALFHFLRRVGLPAVHHIGGQFNPFLAIHAWVEIDNAVVLDDPQCSRNYRAITSMPA